jgi:hypothetical protein
MSFHSSEKTPGLRVDFEQAEAIVRRLLSELRIGDAGLCHSIEPEATAPLMADLKANIEELSEICEVASERSLTTAQLRALTEVELAVETLQSRADHFLALIYD